MTRTFPQLSAGARKSLGAYKPLMISEFQGRKSTTVIGTSSDPWNADGSAKLGRFGSYRGITFPTRIEALEFAELWIAERVRKEAEHYAWMLYQAKEMNLSQRVERILQNVPDQIA